MISARWMPMAIEAAVKRFEFGSSFFSSAYSGLFFGNDSMEHVDEDDGENWIQ